VRDIRELIVGPYRIFFRVDGSIVGTVRVQTGGATSRRYWLRGAFVDDDRHHVHQRVE
jgi:hypothetical protein